MTAVFLFFIPAGIYSARFGRANLRTRFVWMPTHYTMNAIISLPIFIIAWALGVKAADPGMPTFKSAHTRIGLAVLVLICVQIAFGTLIHLLYKPGRTKTPIGNALHKMSGRVIWLLGVANILDGMFFYGSTLTPFVLFGVWFGILVFTYIGLELFVGSTSHVENTEGGRKGWEESQGMLGEKKHAIVGNESNTTV